MGSNGSPLIKGEDVQKVAGEKGLSGAEVLLGWLGAFSFLCDIARTGSDWVIAIWWRGVSCGGVAHSGKNTSSSSPALSTKVALSKKLKSLLS